MYVWLTICHWFTGSSSHPPPNLPPRLQRAHQHSSTFQPRFHAVAQGQPPHSSSSSSSLSSGFGGPSHQQHYYQHRGFGGARQQQQQQPLQPQWRPEGGGGGGGSRPRVGSASDNPGNRLHPQHTLSSTSPCMQLYLLSLYIERENYWVGLKEGVNLG